MNRLDLPFPKLEDKALRGSLGECAVKLGDESEASVASILIHLLVGIGNLFGRKPFSIVRADEHYPNLFVGIVGESSKGRKGSGWHVARWLLRQLDDDWPRRCWMHGGLVTGQGVLWRLRDPTSKDEGEEDKRLLIIEEEFGKVLKLAADKTSIISPKLKDLWDSQEEIRHDTKKDPCTVTGAHCCLLAQITVPELLELLSLIDIKNGFANRIIWWMVRKVRNIANPQPLQARDYIGEVQKLREIVAHVRGREDQLDATHRRIIGGIHEMVRSEKANRFWESLYDKLETPANTFLDDFLSRASAHVLRLSMLYALLDKSAEIRSYHIEAAYAVWQYSEQSVAYIFSRNIFNSRQQKLAEALQQAGDKGLTRTQVSNLVYANNTDKQIIDQDMEIFINGNYVTQEFIPRRRGGAAIQKYTWNGAGNRNS